MRSDRPNRDIAPESDAESGDDSSDPDGTSDKRRPRGVGAGKAASGPEICVDVQNATGRRWTLTPLRRLAQWLESVLREEAPDAATATVRFVSDEEMRELNRTYRGFDKSTDVLSFPGDLPPRADAERSRPAADGSGPVPPRLPGQEPHLGDVVIAVPTAKRQAAERGHRAEHELRLLMLHGVLHCLGYDHEVDDGTMERVEAELRRKVLPEVAA